MSPRLARHAAAWLATAAAAAAQAGADARAALVEQLASTDAQLRQNAYNQLWNSVDAALAPLLGKRIATMPPTGQEFAMNLLEMAPIEATRPIYAKLLDADRVVLRVHAAAKLLRHGDAARAAALAAALTATPPDDRDFALGALWNLDGAGAAIDAVRGYVTADAAPGLVASALRCLQTIENAPSPASIAVVRELSKSDNAAHRAVALTWLLATDDGAAHGGELAKLLEDQGRFHLVEQLFPRNRKLPAELGGALATNLAEARWPPDVGHLAPLLKSAAPELLAPTLRKLLEHDNVEIAAAAMQELAGMPGALSPKDCQQMLQSGKPGLQLSIATMLRTQDDLSGLATVQELARQPGPHRARALGALGGFRRRDVVPILIDALDDADLAVREAAWRSLGDVLPAVVPYRRLDLGQAGYDPTAADRSKGIAVLRRWWESLP